MRQDTKANIGKLAQSLYMTMSKSQRKWGYRKDRVRGRNVWDSQLLDTILTVITLAVVDLLFAVRKVVRCGGAFSTLNAFFLQLGEDLVNEHETESGWRRQPNPSSYPVTGSIDATTQLPPPTPHHRLQIGTRLTSSGRSSFSSSASSLVIYPSFTSPSLGSGASQ